MDFRATARLLDSRRWQPSLARLLLQVVQLLLGVVQSLLLLRSLIVVLAFLVGPGFGVAQLIASIGVVSRLAQLPFAGADIELAFQARDLILLLLDIFF